MIFNCFDFSVFTTSTPFRRNTRVFPSSAVAGGLTAILGKTVVTKRPRSSCFPAGLIATNQFHRAELPRRIVTELNAEYSRAGTHQWTFDLYRHFFPAGPAAVSFFRTLARSLAPGWRSEQFAADYSQFFRATPARLFAAARRPRGKKSGRKKA